jgi:hypothetical protein
MALARSQRWLPLYVGLGLACLLALQGCAPPGAAGGGSTGQGGTPNGPFAKKVDDFSTIGEGAAIGAATGGLLGLAFGHDLKSTAIGAGAGAIVGAGVGGLVANAQNSFASREDQLNRLIADSQKQNEALDSMLTVSRQQLEQERQQIALLRGKLSGAATPSTDDRRQLAQLKGDAILYDKAIQAADKRLETLRSDLNAYRSRYPADDVKTIEASIDSFSAKRTDLVAIKASYTQLMTTVGADGKI